MAYAFSEKSIDVYKQHSLVIGKRVLVHSPSNLCWTWHSINDAKDERIPKVNVPEQSSQSMSIFQFFDDFLTIFSTVFTESVLRPLLTPRKAERVPT